MSVWAIADLHLSFGVANKQMDIFGNQWENHPEKIRQAWEKSISKDDLVLIAGDISWAKDPEDALKDLQWIDSLPGTKVMIKGNHDYWWTTFNKVKSLLPPSIHVIQNNAYHWNDVAIGGTRLWDTSEYHFGFAEIDEKVFARELQRLEMSLKQLSSSSRIKIAMTHYPPIGPELSPSKTSALLEKYQISICVFGHLHGLPPNNPLFGERNGIKYYLTACDYLNFTPLKIL